MRQPIWRMMIGICLILVLKPVCAMPSDAEVAAWTSNVLMLTLRADYKQLQNHTQYKQYRQYYSGQAATGISTFFHEFVPIMIENKLITSPKPLGPPVVTEKGQMNDVNYWQVSQTFYMSALDKKIWFSVIVIENESPPLLIQSLNMKLLK